MKRVAGPPIAGRSLLRIKHASSIVGHAVASAAVIAGAAALGTCTYFALLAWAVVSGETLGGPLALPFLLSAIVLAALAAVLLVFLPSTLLGRLFSRSMERKLLREMAIVSASAMLLALSLGTALGWLYGDVLRGLKLSAICAPLLLVPLGAYWWCLRSTSWLLALAGRRLGARFPSRSEHA